MPRPLAQVTREARRAFISLLTALPLDARGTLGYAKAEVTAGACRSKRSIRAG